MIRRFATPPLPRKNSGQHLLTPADASVGGQNECHGGWPSEHANAARRPRARCGDGRCGSSFEEQWHGAECGRAASPSNDSADEAKTIVANGQADLAVEIGKNLAEAANLSKLEGAIEVGAVGLFTLQALQELNRCEKKADEIKNGFDNDATNIAVAGNLAFDPSFSMFEAVRRPGASKNAISNLTIELQKPENKQVLTALQARADEGFMAADRAMKATANVPPQQRSAAIKQWFADNGFGERMKSDLAFAQGVRYHAFVQEPLSQDRGLRLDVERQKVEARMPLERPFMVSQ